MGTKSCMSAVLILLSCHVAGKTCSVVGIATVMPAQHYSPVASVRTPKGLDNIILFPRRLLYMCLIILTVCIDIEIVWLDC